MTRILLLGFLARLDSSRHRTQCPVIICFKYARLRHASMTCSARWSEKPSMAAEQDVAFASTLHTEQTLKPVHFVSMEVDGTW